ncbi:MAG TPA: hypothetical protein VJ044_12405 [Candidatus Hodarchaeales archaeon]|nr:hypothetical protein [Candidatus Hodarchaeales archaeon]
MAYGKAIGEILKVAFKKFPWKEVFITLGQMAYEPTKEKIKELIGRLGNPKPKSEKTEDTLAQVHSRVLQLEQDVATTSIGISTLQEQQTAFAEVIRVFAARVKLLAVVSVASLLIAIACIVYILAT